MNEMKKKHLLKIELKRKEKTLLKVELKRLIEFTATSQRLSASMSCHFVFAHGRCVLGIMTDQQIRIAYIIRRIRLERNVADS